jgi:hypothetical protein
MAIAQNEADAFREVFVSWARRPKSDEPMAEQRTIADDTGRTWIGIGGEENAEVIWVCADQPSEAKRVSDLGVPARRADEHWLELSNDEVLDVFRDSRIAE